MRLLGLVVRRTADPARDGEEAFAEAMCPPHDFEAAWGNPAGDVVMTQEATVPILFCHACGDIRLLQVPS